MPATITPMAVVLAFGLFVVARYFFIPLLREWPGDLPETESLKRFDTPRAFIGALKAAAAAKLKLLARPGSAGVPGMGTTVLDRAKIIVAVAYRCDLCSYLYAQTAVDKGADSSHVRRLLEGNLRGSPAGDAPLLRAAKAFASDDGTKAGAKPRSAASDRRKETGDRFANQPDSDAVRESRLAARFASMCCNTVLHYQRGRLDDAERKKLYLVYELARPIEWLVAREAGRREMYRTRVEG